MQDRDYYKDWLKEKEGGFNQKPLNVLARRSKKMKQWHPVLIGLAAVFICVVVFGVLKIVSKFSS